MPVTGGEAKLVEYQRGRSGHFYTAFFKALEKADGDNTDRIAKGFPEEIDAYTRYNSETDYWEDLQKRYDARYSEKSEPEGYWNTEDPNFPCSDWQYEVQNGDTRLGYHEWVKCKNEQRADDEEFEKGGS